MVHIQSGKALKLFSGYMKTNNTNKKIKMDFKLSIKLLRPPAQLFFIFYLLEILFTACFGLCWLFSGGTDVHKSYLILLLLWPIDPLLSGES